MEAFGIINTQKCVLCDYISCFLPGFTLILSLPILKIGFMFFCLKLYVLWIPKYIHVGRIILEMISRDKYFCRFYSYWWRRPDGEDIIISTKCHIVIMPSSVLCNLWNCANTFHSCLNHGSENKSCFITSGSQYTEGWLTCHLSDKQCYHGWSQCNYQEATG